MVEELLLHELEHIEMYGDTSGKTCVIDVAKEARLHIIKLVGELHQKDVQIDGLCKHYNSLSRTYNSLKEEVDDE